MLRHLYTKQAYRTGSLYSSSASQFQSQLIPCWYFLSANMLNVSWQKPPEQIILALEEGTHPDMLLTVVQPIQKIKYQNKEPSKYVFCCSSHTPHTSDRKLDLMSSTIQTTTYLGKIRVLYSIKQGLRSFCKCRVRRLAILWGFLGQISSTFLHQGIRLMMKHLACKFCHVL